MKFKTGDDVLITSGQDKGKIGIIVGKNITNPLRVMFTKEGINVVAFVDQRRLMPISKDRIITKKIIDCIMSVYGLEFGQKFTGVGMQGYAFFTDDYDLHLEKIDDYKRALNILTFHPKEVEIYPQPKLMTHDQIAAALGHDFVLVEEKHEKE